MHASTSSSVTASAAEAETGPPTIQLVRDAPPSPEVSRTETESPNLAKATVLIIDDELPNVRLLERILGRAGCANCIGTTSSRQALSLFLEHEPDLVLTDWLMPEHDGCAVIDEIRDTIGSEDYVPIVVLTADVNPATRRRALSAGATDFLTKPFDQLEVLLRVENLLATRFAHLKVQEQNTTLEQHVRQRTIELEHALSELKKTQRQVVQQERLAALGAMAGGIAHDFNNALSVIMGFSDILLSGSDDGLTREEAVQPLTAILTAAEDASKIVGRLREFYRPDRTQDDVRVAINFNELIEQAISLTKPRWETQSRAAGKPVFVDSELGEIGFVSGDPAALREVLTNLIFNAVDAMPNGGKLTLRSSAENNTVRIDVIDSGTGMTEEVRERCLEPFFTTKGKKGTGLGLAMVFGIVQRHSGSMDIESTLGIGTTFILRFPTTAPPAKHAADTADAVCRPLRILVVDDQPVLCQLMCEYLQDDFHSVETADNAQSALQKFRSGEFDLVITDQVMTEMNGEQLAAEIKHLAPNVPVILVTGFASESAAPEKSRAIDYVLAKPMSRATLRRGLAAAMTRES